MPTYKVLRPIERGDKLYLPAEVKDAAESVTSASHGRPIPTDVSGVIVLSEAEAAALDLGQIPWEDGRPLSEERKAKAKPNGSAAKKKEK